MRLKLDGPMEAAVDQAKQAVKLYQPPCPPKTKEKKNNEGTQKKKQNKGKNGSLKHKKRRIIFRVHIAWDGERITCERSYILSHNWTKEAEQTCSKWTLPLGFSQFPGPGPKFLSTLCHICKMYYTPVNAGVFTRNWVPYGPVSQIAKGGPVTFFIAGTSSYFKYLRQMVLQLYSVYIKTDFSHSLTWLFFSNQDVSSHCTETDCLVVHVTKFISTLCHICKMYYAVLKIIVNLQLC